MSEAAEGPSEVVLSASEAFVHLPVRVTARARQSTISFQAIVDSPAVTQTVSIQASAFGSTVEERISVQASGQPVLSARGRQFAIFDQRLAFQVTASSGILAATSLPSGAGFDPTSGVFEWTPAASQAGLFKVIFSVTDAAQRSSAAEVQIQTGSGAPVIDTVQNAASGSTDSVCSSGSLATAGGGWLAPGTEVLVNRAPVPVVFASTEQVTFVCPSLAAGTPIEVAVQTAAGRSNALKTVLRDSALGIFTVDGAAGGQAAATIIDGSLIAMPRNHRFAAEPAQAGDQLRIPVTGISAGTDPNLLSIQIGDLELPAASVEPVAAGVSNVTVSVPAAAPLGAAIPVAIRYRSPKGEVTASQTATIAIEAILQ
ncbi:MAG: putative Ig domain-containing protein [Bryobacterales bacterium]|nr:putative Ig domain-containing protein [Bryobacterales bacterium]MBV9397638.1 putative Ig domain-containing protein [Bryobacterales bacterium]